VRIFGEPIRVHAHVHTINGFSAHADQSGLLSWLRRMPPPERVFLVHGEEQAMRSFAGLIEDCQVTMPALHEEHRL
jgi:metallo-beta-lactamase family protein